jgi:hypothetical protein
MRSLAILTVRNEGAFLLEWLAHHRAVGFSDFLVFSNDCEDGTDAILDRLAEMDWLTHLPNPGPYDKGGIQFTALKQAAKHANTAAADWILPLDVDEFVNIHIGDGTLQALVSALPDATAITLTWRNFGNAGQVRYADALITETFTKAAPEIMHWPWRSAMFKTFYRNDGIYRKPGVHRPRDVDDTRLSEAQWYDSHGRKLDDQFKTRRIFNTYGRPNYGLAQLNHYPLGAMESYVLKAARGRAVHSDDMLGLDYWVERNFNLADDTSIQRYTDARDALLSELKADAQLAELHAKAVAWRHARFDALMLQEPYRALFGRLLMAAPSRMVTPQGARFMIEYANKGRKGS